MKRQIAWFSLILMLTPCQIGIAQIQHVSDQADIFTPMEKIVLESRMQSIYDTYGFDTVILTTNNSRGKTAQAYSENYYNEFRPYSAYPDGLIFSLNFDLGEYDESARGIGKTIFKEGGEAELYAVLSPYLPSKSYYDAMSAYLTYIETKLSESDMLATIQTDTSKKTEEDEKSTISVAFSDNPDAIEKAAESVLFLVSLDKFGEVISTGSGFIAFNNQTVVTNHHVIEDAISVYAMDENDNLSEVSRILSFNADTDLAILLLKEPTNLLPLRLADASAILKRGQQVVAIGSPEGLINTVSMGNISALYRRNDTPDIQFTAPISHGSSGGALFNNKGEVIGVTSATHKEGQNINFAVGISHVIELYDGRYLGSSRPIPTLKATNEPTSEPTKAPQQQAPQGLAGTSTSSGVKLNWDEVVGAYSYRVFHSNTIDGEYKLIGLTSIPSYFDATAKTGMPHFYRITAFTYDGVTPYAEVSVNQFYETKHPPTNVPTPTKRPIPSQLPSPAFSPPPLSFITPSEISRYKTLKTGMNDPDVGKLKQRMYELGYFKTNTVNNNYTETTAEYVREFQRVNGLVVDGIASPEMQALFFSKYAIPKPAPTPNSTKTPKLQPPQNIKAQTSARSVNLTWSAVSGASFYYIYRSLKVNDNYMHIETVRSPHHIDISVKSGSTYYYKIKSIDPSGDMSIYSDYVKAVVPKATATPYVEPKYPIVIGNSAYTGTVNSPYLNPDIVNVSQRVTVDGFTITYMCQNVYGDYLTFEDSNSKFSEFEYAKTIGPGRTVDWLQ